MRRTPNGEHPFGCACGGDLPHDQYGMMDGWCEPCRDGKHADCWMNLPWYNCRCPVCRTIRETRR